MKTATRILAVWGCIATIPLIYLLVVHLDSEGIVEFRQHPQADYYFPADLQVMNLPRWDLTNTVPLSPDGAVRAAMRYGTELHPEIVAWDVDRISLERQADDVWSYNISLVDRKSGRYSTAYVKVLMDGRVWKPQKGPRNG
ncbi:MAG: hypothetical protein ACXW32_03915 [Limisphaerales bacterium]